MIRRPVLLLLLIFPALVPAFAGNLKDQNPEAALNDQYRDKILALRHPLEKNSQLYDTDGNVLKGGHEGPWTLYGRVLVKKIRVEKDSVLIEGRRLNYIKFVGDLVPTPAGNLKIEIKLGKPVSSAEEMDALLGRVFALSDEDMIESAPAFWRHYLKNQIARAHGQEPQKDAATRRTRGVAEIKVIEGIAGKDGEPVAVLHQTGGGTTAPKAIYTPEPEYTDVARHEKYQGTLEMEMIVDQTGNVRQPRITRPLGMGLDENAVNKVLTWKFDPATVDNKPVAVLLKIEVSFNLY